LAEQEKIKIGGRIRLRSRQESPRNLNLQGNSYDALDCQGEKADATGDKFEKCLVDDAFVTAILPENDNPCACAPEYLEAVS